MSNDSRRLYLCICLTTVFNFYVFLNDNPSIRVVLLIPRELQIDIRANYPSFHVRKYNVKLLGVSEKVIVKVKLFLIAILP